MRLNAAGGQEALTPLLDKLANHLCLSADSASAAQSLGEAIAHWLDAEAANLPSARPTSRGYQWKNLFLPDGTELRMTHADSMFYARVIGDRIMYERRSVSPRGMTLAIAGEGRNAWRDLWLRLPGQPYWKQAVRCRHEFERALRSSDASPADSINAAAAAMADALKTTLALVEHAKLLVKAKTSPAVERRAHGHRRESDVLADICFAD